MEKEKDGGTEPWFFVGLFLFIFIIWIAVGGPTRGLSFQGPLLNSDNSTSTSLSGGTSFSLPKAPFRIGESHVVLPGSSSGGSLLKSSGVGTPVTLSGIAYGVPSPYQGLVSMSHYVSGAGANESIRLQASPRMNTPINVSGWTLKSEATEAASSIPRGTGLPTSGIVNAAQDIVLLPGEQAIVVFGSSPVGTSFKENKCVGYFAQFQRFSPSLPQNCPVPMSELQTHYQGTYIKDAVCIDYVDGLSRCQAALSPPSTVSGACQSFLVTYLNYNGCVNAHNNDPDFSGTTWRIYLGRTTPLFRTKHEVVKLLDAGGNTVDAFSY
ncbi:MAG: hypothetical protein Q7S95_04080 [bacterium]|nr:hypothetical protein [bacterium]